MSDSNKMDLCGMWQHIKQMQTPEELVRFISAKWARLGATALLVGFCWLPIVAGALFTRPDFVITDDTSSKYMLLSSTRPYSDFYYRMICTVGLLVLIFSAYFISKSYYAQKNRCQAVGVWLRNRIQLVFFAVLLCWCVVSFLLSSNHFRSFFGTGYRHDGLLSYIIYFGIFVAAASITAHQSLVVMENFVAAGAIVSMIGVSKSFFGGIFEVAAGSAAAVFNQENHFGYYLAMCIPACIVLLLNTKSSPKKPYRAVFIYIVRYAELWLLANALLYNGTRGAAIAVVTALICTNVIVASKFKAKVRILLLADLLVIATAFVLNTNNNLFNKVLGGLPHAQDAFSQIVSDSATAESADNSALMQSINLATHSRGSMWSLGVQFALEKPLFGYGPDNLGQRYLDCGLKYTDRPHNEFIQIAASLGFPALLLYLCGLASHFRKFISSMKQMELFEIGGWIVAGSYLISSVFGNSMFYTTPYFYMFLGFTYASIRSKNHSAVS